jgi:antitoxin component YwqK of YwqJK toxin-antitoxin module
MKVAGFVLSILISCQIFNLSTFAFGEVNLKLTIIKDTSSANPIYEVLFYENGEEIAKRVYQEGKTLVSEGRIPEGIAIERYPGGNIKNIITYKDQKRNGKAFGFYESGKLKIEACYRNDNPIGIGKRYYENGNLMAERKIIDSKEIYHREYDETGRLKEEEKP